MSRDCPKAAPAAAAALAVEDKPADAPEVASVVFMVVDVDSPRPSCVTACLLCGDEQGGCRCPPGVGKWRWAVPIGNWQSHPNWADDYMRDWYAYCDWRMVCCAEDNVDFTWVMPGEEPRHGGWFGSTAGMCSLAAPCGYC